jgi:hypothetical protein
MSAEWKSLDTQNKSLPKNPPEDEDLDDHSRNYWTDTVVRPKQVIYWSNFMTKRRRRRRRRRRHAFKAETASYLKHFAETDNQYDAKLYISIPFIIFEWK